MPIEPVAPISPSNGDNLSKKKAIKLAKKKKEDNTSFKNIFEKALDKYN
jgi:hypothetical protein